MEKKLNTVLLEMGKIRSKIDSCIYYRITGKDVLLFIAVYVDDLLYFFNKDETALKIKDKLQEKFQMKDMGTANQCLGLRITRKENEKEICIDQSIYINKIISRFNMKECKPVYTPCDVNIRLAKAEHENEIKRDIPYQEAIGCLLYLSQGTRPDITFIVNLLSRFNNQPTAQHWVALKRVVRYLKGPINLKLTFNGNENNIVGFCDADWASAAEDRTSCTGYVFFLFQGTVISWASKCNERLLYPALKLNMFLASGIQVALWLKQLEQEFWPTLKGTYTYYNDVR